MRPELPRRAETARERVSGSWEGQQALPISYGLGEHCTSENLTLEHFGTSEITSENLGGGNN